MKATYRGDDVALRGHTAIVQVHPNDPNQLLAKFDSWALGRHLTHAWTAYPEDDFEVEASLDQLREDESECLLRFRARFKKSWKEELSTWWSTDHRHGTPRDRALLQSIRNRLGPAWLDAIT